MLNGHEIDGINGADTLGATSETSPGSALEPYTRHSNHDSAIKNSLSREVSLRWNDQNPLEVASTSSDSDAPDLLEERQTRIT
ncbi:hypothetical protein L916_20350 [Phytophthora nicotianae]|uniref:Uncharacterized protein n=1 Tax=Phytophthora nicotianae TaxID=4792 RepID=W2HXI2_PHYNI|nr:hypothetical protein L916_20350 [Phytophthora nicotianae]